MSTKKSSGPTRSRTPVAPKQKSLYKRLGGSTFLVAAGVITALVVIVVFTSGGGGDTGVPISSQTSKVVVTGMLPEVPDEGADPAIGMVAPKLAGENFDSEAVVIEPGKARILVFAAHWCPACNKEIPEIVDHLKKNPLANNVEVVLVSTSVRPEAPNYPASEWLTKKMAWPYVVLADSQNTDAARAYGLTKFPYFVAVDAQGEVVDRDVGIVPMQRFDQMVKAATRLNGS